MVFLSKTQILELFKEFNIINYEEKEWNGKTGLGKMKHWHIHEIVARKK